MLRPVMSTMRKVRMIAASIDGSAVNGGTKTTNGIGGADQHLTISETGNGAYTIYLNNPGSMPCFAMATPVTDNSIVYIGSCTNGSVAVTQETASTGVALADADFNIIIYASDAEDET